MLKSVRHWHGRYDLEIYKPEAFIEAPLVAGVITHRRVNGNLPSISSQSLDSFSVLISFGDEMPFDVL
jgi:hypothetical protein